MASGIIQLAFSQPKLQLGTQPDSMDLHPLPDARLPRVDVGPIALAQWKSEAERLVRSVIHNHQSWYFRFQDYQHLYKPIYAKHNTHGCARVIKKTKMVEFLSRSELDMTLDELATSLYCETTSDQRAVYVQLHRESLTDGALLKLFEGPTPGDPFHCVSTKWVALRSPMSKIFKGSDFIYFEYCFTTTDIYGRKVLIEFQKSQRWRPDQLEDHDLDLARGSIFVLNTYHMENNRVVMQSLGEHDIARKFPVWFALAVMPTYFEHVQYYHGLVCAKALTVAGVTVNSLADRCADVSTDCRICSKKFKLTRGKKWCRRCGHPICRDCMIEIVMLKGGAVGTSRLPFTRERFCALCLFIVREQRTAAAHESMIDRPSSLFSIYPEQEEVTKFQMSCITAAVHSMDRIVDRRPRRSMNESLLSLSMLKTDDQDEDEERPISRRTTRSSSFYYVEREPLTTEPRASMHKQPIDLASMARVAADQAAKLRSMYHQECMRWQCHTQARRCSITDEIAPSSVDVRSTTYC